MRTSFALITLALAAVVLQTTWAKPHPQFSFNFGVGGNINVPSNNQIIPTATEAYIPAAYQADGSNNGDSSKSEPQNILEIIFSGIDEAIRNASRLGEETTKTFFENILIASEAFLDNANDLGEAIEDNFRELVHQSVANFRAIVHAFITGVDQQILAVRNRIKRQALLDVETQLEDLYDSLNGLHGHVEELRVNWQHDIEHQEMIIVRRWNIWAGEQLERVADATNGDEQKIAEAESIINEFVNRYGNYLTQCADEVEEELQEYEQQVDNTVQQYEPILGSLIEEVDQCLQDSDTNAAGRRCSRQFKEHLRQLRGSSVDFIKLTAAGAQLGAERFQTRYCVAQTLIEVGLEKFAVERQLVELILRQEKTENSDDNEESDAPAESGSSEGSESQEGASIRESSAGSSAEASDSVASGSEESGNEESGSEESGSEESGSIGSGSEEPGSASESSGESASSEESTTEVSTESAADAVTAANDENNEFVAAAITNDDSSGESESNESNADAASSDNSNSQSESDESPADGDLAASDDNNVQSESNESIADAAASDNSNSQSESDESAADGDLAASDDNNIQSESNVSIADADASDDTTNSDSSDSSA